VQAKGDTPYDVSVKNNKQSIVNYLNGTLIYLSLHNAIVAEWISKSIDWMSLGNIWKKIFGYLKPHQLRAYSVVSKQVFFNATNYTSPSI
jgi:hypothetical protein